MIHQFLPKDWQTNENQKRCYDHSHTVANAAKLIASHTTDLNWQKAYTFGVMHDIGKFYLKPEEKYKHPRVGYELLRNTHPDVALICLTHPFPNFNSYEHILHYHHDDVEEANKVFNLLKNIKEDIYIHLIQFCDKVSRINDYIRWEDKLNWYLETYNLDPNEITNQYSLHLQMIKNTLDTMINGDVYELLGL
ncbi:MAG: HD domain-containing protein [Alphaproteobacteria bacterium]|nr:HD domain-containing protein [Alphaproteobacteria bacterium]